MKIRSFIGTHDENWEDTQVTRHDSLEVTAILAGRGIFRHDAKQYTVDAGQIVVIPSKVPHSFHAVTPIRFGVLLMDDVTSEQMPMFDSLLEERAHPAIITLSKLDREEYETLFRQWLSIAASSLKAPLQSHTAWLQVLLLYIYEHSQAGSQAVTVAQIADYIRDHLGAGLNIADLAAIVGLTEDGLRKRFYAVYGMSPKNFQQICRLKEAKWLISSTEKDIGKIAEEVGFSQVHSFSSWFKKMEGAAPTQWRKNQRMDHE